LDVVQLAILVVAVLGFGWVYWIYRRGQARNQSIQTQIPSQWEIRLRPLYNEVDRSVWLWLKQVFPEHEVLVKVPVIRFLSGSSGDLKAMVQIKDIYCSFTLCTPKGRVLGCIDIPGAQGLKASRRDLKKKLFNSLGLPYAVFSAHDLPTQEALRALFLGETLPPPSMTSQFEETHASQVFEFTTSPETTQLSKMPAPEPIPEPVRIDPVVNVRHNLHVKLEGNRKRRLAAMESLKTSAGVVEDNPIQGFAPRWEDSFIMGDRPSKTTS
jgi:Protein of unknown function (DUF2726)